MRRAKFSPRGKEAKAGVNLSPLLKLQGHAQGKATLRLLFADSISVNIGCCGKARSWPVPLV